MQTFLPLPWPKNGNSNNYTSLYQLLEACFKASCNALDNKRLCKQRVEAMQLINLIKLRKQLNVHGRLSREDKEKHFTSKGVRMPTWINHVATLMWEDHLETLCLYMNVTIDTWCSRKNKNGQPTKNTMVKNNINVQLLSLPPFIGNNEFHATHRANLIRKDINFYGTKWHDIPCTGYLWIIKKEFNDQRKFQQLPQPQQPKKRIRNATNQPHTQPKTKRIKTLPNHYEL